MEDKIINHKSSYLRTLFSGLSWTEIMVLCTMCATVVAIALWWRLGIIMISLLSAVSIFKIFYTATKCTPSPLHNNNLSSTQRICLWSMIAYWLLYAVSAIVSDNHAEGWSTALIKLYFLVLPLLCLFGNTTYLTSGRIKTLFQLFTATLLVRFAICLIICVFSILHGSPFDEVKDWQMDPLGMHHNYLALHIDIAIAYLYTRIASETSRKIKIKNIVCILILIAYLFLISSRSGIVALALLFLAIIIHITFFQKKYKISLAIVGLSLLAIATLYITLPSLLDRFISLTQWTENYYPDDRVIAWICGINATEGHLLFGHGSGDYLIHLNKAFEDFGYQRAIEKGYNSHCQYIGTLLETGIVGLVFFLFMLLAPWILTKRKNGAGSYQLLTALVIVVVAAMNIFEEMFNRQMGTQIIASVYCLLILTMGETTSHEDTCQIDYPHHD